MGYILDTVFKTTNFLEANNLFIRHPFKKNKNV